jgi:ammonia channel protein AmtB
VIGVVSGIVFFWACSLKFKFSFDDSLDVFRDNCVDALLTGVFAKPAAGG